jgi:hypothetical protein
MWAGQENATADGLHVVLEAEQAAVPGVVGAADAVVSD